MKEIKIFGRKSQPVLIKQICQQLGIPPSTFKIEEYPNGCFEVFLQNDVKDCKVFLIQTSVPQTLHRDLWELFQLVSAARLNGASEVTAIIPYVSYARSDKTDKPGMTVSGELLAKLLETSGITRFIGIGFHSNKFKKFFSKETKVYHLSALPLIVKYLKMEHLENAILLPGDKGAFKKASLLGRKLNIPVGSVHKTRLSGKKVRIEKITGKVAGKDVVFFDDEISPAATTVTTLGKELEKRGAKSLIVVVTHASIVRKTVKNLSELKTLKKIIITDTVPISEEIKKSLPIEVLSVAGILVKTIKKISGEDL
jgi:ribose-phosphate pyrophosphokinase